MEAYPAKTDSALVPNGPATRGILESKSGFLYSHHGLYDLLHRQEFYALRYPNQTLSVLSDAAGPRGTDMRVCPDIHLMNPSSHTPLLQAYLFVQH